MEVEGSNSRHFHETPKVRNFGNKKKFEMSDK